MEKIKREIKFEADFSLVNKKLKKATDSIKELKNIEIEVKLMDVENKDMSTDKIMESQTRKVTIDYSNTTLGMVEFEAEVLLNYRDIDGSKIIVLKTSGIDNPNLDVELKQ